jgi:transcriptional regulator with XRE-family HTH domain
MPKLSTKDRDRNSLGGRLTSSRLRHGWTQHELAAKVGTSQAVVQRIETGKCRHPRIITPLAEALDVSPAWLMYGATAIDGLDQEAIETARAWSRLAEPHRSALRDMILQSVRAADSSNAQRAATAEPAQAAPSNPSWRHAS